MAISEIGLLKLKSTASLDDPELREKLSQIKSNLEKFTGHDFHYLQQIEDPNYIYMLGQWQSLEQHYKELHSSTDWQEMVPIMQKHFDFQWMAHYDFALDNINVDTPVLGLARYVMSEGDRKNAEDSLDKARSSLKDSVGGWKVDGGRKSEEAVLLAPNEKLQEQQSIKDLKIGDATEQADIKHMRLIKNI
ncbi:hypothetical protein BT63DRAFT_423279 [Microthyrium microscopicum]|uniref:ABM domain-containing protein n=1 Tax=Microthyrium microscopicum TaxID=703497 RepID=A0A6A6UFQ6_9PEZI|nr:hypothetical protein BT63DRAFT_423279 [Microthyrium microscopicum]